MSNSALISARGISRTADLPRNPRVAMMGETVSIAKHTWRYVRTEHGGVILSWDAWVAETLSSSGRSWAMQYTVDGGRIVTVATFMDRALALGAFEKYVDERSEEFERNAEGRVTA